MPQQPAAVAAHVSASIPRTSVRNCLSAAYEVDNTKKQISQQAEQSSPNSRSNCKAAVTSVTGEAFDDISLRDMLLKQLFWSRTGTKLYYAQDFSASKHLILSKR